MSMDFLPANVADAIVKLRDMSIPQDKRQNYRKSLADIRDAVSAAIVRFDAECTIVKKQPAKKFSRSPVKR